MSEYDQRVVVELVIVGDEWTMLSQHLLTMTATHASKQADQREAREEMGMKGSEGEKRSAQTISVVRPIRRKATPPSCVPPALGPRQQSYHFPMNISFKEARMVALFAALSCLADASLPPARRRHCGPRLVSRPARPSSQRPSHAAMSADMAQLQARAGRLVSDTQSRCCLTLPIHTTAMRCTPPRPVLHSAWHLRGQTAGDEHLLSWSRWSFITRRQGWPWSWPWFSTSGCRRDQEQVPDWGRHDRTCASA